MILFHNPRCSKSRQALQLLKEQGADPEIRLYLDNPPDRAELLQLLDKLSLKPRDLLRKSEQLYKDNNLKSPALSDEQLIAAMVEHPRLIERPIAIVGDRAVVGRPPENVLELLS